MRKLLIAPLAVAFAKRIALLALATFAILVLPAQAASQQIHVAVVLVEFQDYQTHSVTPTQVQTNWFTGSRSVSAWLNETSYGQAQIANVDVRGWFTIPYSVNGPCNFNTDWEAAARARAGDLSAYDHLAFVFSSFRSCGAVAYGAGTLASGTVWGGPDLGFDIGIAAHEFAHSIGLPHAGTTACTTCALAEGGDSWTVWSGQAYSLQGSERVRLGFVAPTLATAGSYTLAPLNVSTGIRVLRVARPDGTYLDVDYRKQGLFGPDLGGPTVRLVTASNSYLIGNPLSPGYVYDAPNRIAIVSTGGGSVEVRFDADEPSLPPPPPPPVVQCSDGLDNDADGKIDLADKQCTSAQDDSEKRR